MTPNIKDINPNTDLDFDENSPFQEGVISKTFQRPDKLFFSGTKRTEGPHKQGKSNSKLFDKTGSFIDKILKII